MTAIHKWLRRLETTETRCFFLFYCSRFASVLSGGGRSPGCEAALRSKSPFAPNDAPKQLAGR